MEIEELQLIHQERLQELQKVKEENDNESKGKIALISRILDISEDNMRWSRCDRLLPFLKAKYGNTFKLDDNFQMTQVRQIFYEMQLKLS